MTAKTASTLLRSRPASAPNSSRLHAVDGLPPARNHHYKKICVNLRLRTQCPSPSAGEESDTCDDPDPATDTRRFYRVRLMP